MLLWKIANGNHCWNWIPLFFSAYILLYFPVFQFCFLCIPSIWSCPLHYLSFVSTVYWQGDFQQFTLKRCKRYPHLGSLRLQYSLIEIQFERFHRMLYWFGNPSTTFGLNTRPHYHSDSVLTSRDLTSWKTQIYRFGFVWRSDVFGFQSHVFSSSTWHWFQMGFYLHGLHLCYLHTFFNQPFP